jgi:hypothetical protein
MDGHAVQVGGVIVDSGNFDWTSGKFPELVEPDITYHGISYVETYGKDMIREFYDYWSEANRPATKMRWEQERTWELNLRLQYWAKRDNKYGRNNKQADAERRQSQIIAQVAELDRKFLAGQTQ